MRIWLEGTAEKLSGFMYFWAKHARGFDNTKHCARCLPGSYEKSFSKDMPLNVVLDVTFREKAFYICGVSKPYRWGNNFHLALVPGTGTVIRKTYNGINVIAEGAEEFVFNGEAAAAKYPQYGGEFLTCRNFQFGVSFFETENGRGNGANIGG
jgi:hypothetical protein